MKTITLSVFLVLLALGLFSTSCSDVKSPVKKMTDVVEEVLTSTPNTTDTISKQRFINWVGNWKADGQQFTTTTLAEFFTLPVVDLTEMLSEPGVKSSRFYLGLDTSHAVDSLHLIVVGVDKLGNDMLDYNNGQYAYDVSKLCPILCAGGQGYSPNPPK